MCSRKRFWVQDVRVVGKNFELSNYDAYLEHAGNADKNALGRMELVV